MKVLAIDFVVTNVSNREKAKAFYQGVLGIQDPISQESGPWMEFDTKPVALALMEMGEAPQTSIALAVEDVVAAVEELRPKGVEIRMEPMDTPDCIMAGIADPDGNFILLHQRKDGTVG